MGLRMLRCLRSAAVWVSVESSQVHIFYCFYQLKLVRYLITAKAEASNVLLTDGDQEVVELAKLNIARNLVGDCSSAEVLRWDDEQVIEAVLRRYADSSSSMTTDCEL